MIHKILVPLDGSLFGEYALPPALAMARRANAAVEIVHVHPPVPAVYVSGEVMTDLTANAALLEQERHYLRNAVQRVARAATVPVTERLLDGPVAETLAAHVRETEADLVVMCTHGRGPLSRLWLGSVADRLIRESTAPVLLVHPQTGAPDYNREPEFGRVVVALDGSELSEQVLEPTTAFCRLMGSRLLLLRVVEPLAFGNAAAGVEAIGPYRQELREAQAMIEHLKKAQEKACREAQTYLETVAARLRGDGLSVQTRVVSNGQPAAAILEQARGESADLIAMATHGRRGISRLLLGSVTDKALRGSTVPMLVQRPRAVGERKAVPAKASAAEFDHPGCFHGGGVNFSGTAG